MTQDQILRILDDLDVLRRDLVTRLERFPDPEQDARTMADQEYMRARIEHNEQEEV